MPRTSKKPYTKKPQAKRAYTKAKPKPKPRARGGWQSYAKKYGGMAGHAAASYLGNSRVASKLFSYIKDIVAGGMGDYTISRPVKNNLFTNDQIPRVPRDNGKLVVCRREYVCDVYSGASGLFYNFAGGFPLNPGMKKTFPWLSQIAANYEEYKWHSLIFEIKTMCVDALNSTNTAAGSVMACVNYNPNVAPFYGKTQFENIDGAVSSKPARSILFGVECAAQPLGGKYYVRTGPLTGGETNLQTYDHGTFQVASVALPNASAQIIAELHVAYEVELGVPILYTALGNEIYQTHLGFVTTGVTPTDIFNAANFWYDNIEVQAVLNVLSLFPAGKGTNLPIGSFVDVRYHVQGANTAGIKPPVTLTLAQCEHASSALLGTTYWKSSTPSANSATWMFETIVKITGLQPTLTFSGDCVFPTAITYANLIISQMNPLDLL